MKLKMLCIQALFFVLTASAAGQCPSEWSTSLGGAGFDRGFGVAPTSDGGCVALAVVSLYGADRNDISLIKLDSCGDTEWTKLIGDSEEYTCSGLVSVADGYIIWGTTRRDFARAPILLYVGFDGTIVKKVQLQPCARLPFALRISQSGEPFIYAFDASNTAPSDSLNIYVMQTNNAERIITIRRRNPAQILSASLFENGSIALLEGVINPQQMSFSSFTVIKTSPEGAVLWSRQINAAQPLMLYNVYATRAEIIACGDAGEETNSRAVYYRLDGNGNVLGRTVIDNDGESQSAAAAAVCAGGIFFAGTVNKNAIKRGYDVWVSHTNPAEE